MKSYLQDRTQFIETDDGRSEVGIVVCGVPQGSLLGPLLYSIYIRDFINSVQNCKVHMYADDTQFIPSFNGIYDSYY